MQKTVEHTGANNRVSPAFLELLIRERNKGKSLRQLGQKFGKSYEWIRKVLPKSDQSPVTLINESRVADQLGYRISWLMRLRKEGIIKPKKPAGRWLYSQEQIRQISLLITETRKCQQCGKPRPPGSRRFCRECAQYRKSHQYERLSPEEKANHIKRGLEWRKANPERWKEIQRKALRDYRARHQVVVGEPG